MGGKSYIERERFFFKSDVCHLRISDVGQLRMSDVRLNWTLSERDFFSPNYSKFAAEYDRKSNISDVHRLFNS